MEIYKTLPDVQKLYKEGRLDEAWTRLNRVETLASLGDTELKIYANISRKKNDPSREMSAISTLAKRHPENEELQKILYERSVEQSNWGEAIFACSRILKYQPNHLAALNNLAVAYKKQRSYDRAHEVIKRALEIHKGNRALEQNLYNLTKESNDWTDLLRLLEQKISGNERSEELYTRYAEALASSDQLATAIEVLTRYLEKSPESLSARNNRGNYYRRTKNFQAALADYGNVLEQQPRNVTALNNYGVALRDLLRLEESLTYIDKALEVAPESHALYYNRGNALSDLRRFEAAIADYEKAISISPQASYYNNLGNAYKELGRKESIHAYTKAIELGSGARTWRNRATVYREQLKYSEAVNDFQKARLLDPDYEYLLGDLIHTKLFMCDWRDYESDVDRLIVGIREGRKMTSPFPVVPVIESAEVHYLCTKTYANDKWPRGSGAITSESRVGKLKNRLGFFSSDFHNHATMHLIKDLFSHLKDAGYEIYGYSINSPIKDEFYKELGELLTGFLDATNLSDNELAEKARSENIDIVFDLKGFTQNCRPGVFQARIAPIQINYLGYPGTTGLSEMDYIVADHFIIPPELEAYYSEKVLRLDGTYQPNNHSRKRPASKFSKANFNLPEDKFIFASFNNHYKITPDCFTAWMTILKRCQDSVLWLMADNEVAQSNLRAKAEAMGVPPSRLIFMKRTEFSDHLSRHELADLQLDTWPCSGHTTASDSIYMGLPIITRPAETFASRVCGSLLTHLGAKDLVAQDADVYVALAERMCEDSDFYLLKRDLFSEGKVRSNIFNTKKYAEDFISNVIEKAIENQRPH
jgi:protein O-GlcNAc transferase